MGGLTDASVKVPNIIHSNSWMWHCNCYFRGGLDNEVVTYLTSIVVSVGGHSVIIATSEARPRPSND